MGLKVFIVLNIVFYIVFYLGTPQSTQDMVSSDDGKYENTGIDKP